ncbi:AAA family ATPase [Phyllobacterium sp.]|uniref:AAA family ATPase n=1 Tax=Nostoc favosum CHAB5714 TaxID=2780399 RepID=A0ABS8IKH0_9NOSO|nr:AAA family ATPase [Phyllobacterium sp.]MCC5604496.1 AAA family ATPase [Nostoc favosum CHAB5714]
MFISHLVIKNFRAISDLSVSLSQYINVIVGPNGVGKTTILQAIRVAKAIAAPRTQQEPLQVLISLGAASPHFPQRLFLSSLARDPSQLIDVRCTYTLTREEIQIAKQFLPEVVQNLVASRVGQNFSNPAMLVQFMQSPQGVAATMAATSELTGLLGRLDAEPTLTLGVALNGVSGQIAVTDPLAGPLIGFLDQRLPPSLSTFSYFPADRALPMGEATLQLGGPDAQQQLEMHNSQPQIKYQRLKNLIINSLVIDDAEKETVRNEFEIIFSKLLKGRSLNRIHVNELGLLSVMTEEKSTGRLIELDSLSSGEKNIALTFLIVAKSVSDSGIALFDEPELHLNPAVSRDILTFMLNQYSKPRNIQFIMCTHSPEILSGAFSSDDCALLHLKSASDITKVGKRALDEYADALHRLGTSVSESLLYEGTVLVEGDDDVAFLETAFPELTRKLKIADRGGRREIEKTISRLQELEKKGQQVAPIYLIFDKDEELTDLKSSAAVKVMQWKRRSIENYMLDSDVISEILKDESATRHPINSAGEVHKLIRELAFEQIDAIAAREAYNSQGYKNSSLTKGDVSDTGLDVIAGKLFTRMSTARTSIPNVEQSEWIANFIEAAKKRKLEISLSWEAKWRDLCDGKRLLSDLYKRSEMKMSETAFKTRITQKMRDLSSEDWRLVRALLDELLAH